MDHLSKFQLNRMVNEPENAILRKTARTRKMVAPGGTNPTPGGSCSAKIRKIAFFVNQNTTHLWYGAWRPIGCRQAVPAPGNLIPFTTTLISINLRLHRIRSQLLGLRFIPNTSHLRIHLHFPLRMLPL